MVIFGGISNEWGTDTDGTTPKTIVYPLQFSTIPIVLYTPWAEIATYSSVYAYAEYFIVTKQATVGGYWYVKLAT